MSHSEASLRRDLAAAYRLAALFGWDDTLYTHFSVRLPGAEPRFLINPFGLLFEEVRASDLLVVDLHGRVIGAEADYNVAGFTIHSALHMAREDAHCVIHTHTLAGMAVAASETGLTQLNQISAEFYQAVGYHDYEGIAFDLGERERLVASLAGHSALILRHHGLLSLGASVADAFYLMYYLNKACEIQLAAAVLPDAREMPASLSRHAREQFQGVEWQRQLLWNAWLRKLERLDPSYQQ
jgi:ribulose-5-phosphate 4-epimerase/fuculose-1-phosphate aldolase